MENKYPSTQARLGTKPGPAHAGFRALRRGGVTLAKPLSISFFLPSFLSHSAVIPFFFAVSLSLCHHSQGNFFCLASHRDVTDISVVHSDSLLSNIFCPRA